MKKLKRANLTLKALSVACFLASISFNIPSLDKAATFLGCASAVLELLKEDKRERKQDTEEE